MGKKVSRLKDETKFEEKKRLEQEKKERAVKKETQKKRMEGVRGIVRVCETNLDGTKKISQALLKIRGVGYALANAMPVLSGFEDVCIGSLSDEQIEHLEDVIKNPAKYGLPLHMVNYPKESFGGESHQVVESDLTMAIKTNIDFMRKIRSYRGVRHELGLPVRGQRTRSSFRTGMIVGVARKGAEKPAKAAEVAPEKTPAGTKTAATVAATAKAVPVQGATKPAAPSSEKAPAKREEKKK